MEYLNLVKDAWIPVNMADGSRQVIQPHQVAEAGVVSLAWDRPDFNLACSELLVGLIYLADPPHQDRRLAPAPHTRPCTVAQKT